MNTYLIPVTKEWGEDFTEIMTIYACTEKQAYLKAVSENNYPPRTVRKYTDVPYDFYEGKLKLPALFQLNQKNDIMKKTLSQLGQNREGGQILTFVDIYDYMYWGDYNAKIKELAEKTFPEKWSFENNDDNYILKNYLKYTFNKLQKENKIIETDNYCVFDTGLFSKYYEPIYAYGEINKSSTDNSAKWYFKGFKDFYELGNLDIEKFPERADYFSDPSRLVVHLAPKN